MCGGTDDNGDMVKHQTGLSPRVRGNLNVNMGMQVDMRSIPACAGEPFAYFGDIILQRVYPRVCGGTLIMLFQRLRQLGLSPRVRGNHGRLVVVGQNERSIPACAGEPDWHIRANPFSRVYPRVCGGTALSATHSISSLGLSPRVRGNHAPTENPCRLRGSIPACAGEPSYTLVPVAAVSVYPRVCGGTVSYTTSHNTPPGLSPRVRGNQRPLFLWPPYTRSIPACAGEPGVAGGRGHVQEVYPRVCGGTSKQFYNSFNAKGLSPRVRGNRL